MLENELGLRAGIYEDHAHPCIANGRIQFGQRVPRHMSRPWNAIVGLQNINLRGHRLRHSYDLPTIAAQPAPRGIQLVDGRREPNADSCRCQRGQARQSKGQQITPLVIEKGVQFINDNISQTGKIGRCILVGQQQRQRFRRCHQKVRRLCLLSLAAR